MVHQFFVIHFIEILLLLMLSSCFSASRLCGCLALRLPVSALASSLLFRLRRVLKCVSHNRYDANTGFDATVKKAPR